MGADKLERTDWLSFAATTLAALAVYSCGLTPDIDLGNSGYFATAAKYHGVPMPAGFPVWTHWAWLFTTFWPFGTTGQRAAFAGSVAGALASGIIALMVCKIGMRLLNSKREADSPATTEEKWLRAVCGFSSGLVFAFNGSLWRMAETADPLPVNMLLLCLVMWTLIVSSSYPDSAPLILLAALLYGIYVSDSLMGFALGPAIPIIVGLYHPKIGRDMLLTTVILLAVGLIPYGIESSNSLYSRMLSEMILTAAIMLFFAAVLMIRTRRMFTKIHIVAFAIFLCAVGQASSLIIAIEGMTNPPADWGHPRTVDGYWHAATRGQYDRLYPAKTLSEISRSIDLYFHIATNDFGWPYMLVAIIPLAFLWKANSHARRDVLAVFTAYCYLAFLTVIVLRPAYDRATLGILRVYLPASYSMLSVLMGCGLMLVGSLALRKPVIAVARPAADPGAA